MTSQADDFASRFSVAVEARRLSLERIQAHLALAGCKVSVATLSYWRSGRSRPWRHRSLQAVSELERILEVPAGHFIEVLPKERRLDWDPLSVLPKRDLTEQAIESLSTDLLRRWSRIMVEDLMIVNERRSETSQTTRMIVEAKVDGAADWPVVFYPDDDGVAAGRITALAGCMVGGVVPIDGTSLLVAQLATPRPLRRGERTMIAYEADFGPTTAESYRVARSLPGPVRLLTLGARFEGPTPGSHHTRASTPGGTPLPMGESSLVGNELRSVTIDTQIGTYSLEWTWG